MFLSSLSVANFRNHRQYNLTLPGFSSPLYISGENGSGKTSLIEAIYLLYTLRTFRQQPLNDIKTFGEDYMRIEGHFSSGDIENVVLFYQQERKLLINGNDRDIPNIAYTHLTPVICYSPSFETLLSQEHSDRRQFLDRVIFYLDKNHMLKVKTYNALLQRKRAELYRDKADRKLLNVLNEQLQPVSEEISLAREALVHNINESIQSIPSAAALLMPDTELVLSINTLARRDLNNEIENHRPMYGAHKDLLYIKKNGKVIEKFQSFGQKKSCLLFLLYHLALIVQSSRKDDILLLFDDFEAGLDDSRIAMLNELISDRKNRQVILSGLANKHHPEACTVEL